jgi:hypothetical protein
MALLLTRSATAMGVALGDGSDEGFTDISGLDAATEKAINQLVQLGVTKGTSATTFSPNDNVTRLQMALFLTRLATAAGHTLGDGSDQGFTDIDGLDAATQIAINQTVQLGIADGTSTTTFSPLSDTLRWHMALFLTRTLAADGVSAALGFIVLSDSAASPNIVYADSDQGKKVTAKTTTSDTFFVDGKVATQGAFFASVGICDLVSVTSGSYSLTNKACSKYTSGVIDLVNLTDDNYAIVEPITGTPLLDDVDDVEDKVAYDGTFTVHTTDGAAVSLAGFKDDLQAGDMVTSTGTGVDATDIRTLALVNVTVSGKAKNVVDGTFAVSPFADTFTPVAADSITVDGSAGTVDDWNDQLTDGDDVTVNRDNGKLTVTLVNKARTATIGKVLNNNDPNTDLVDIADDGEDALTYVNEGTVYIVNGILDDEEAFEAALTAGDDIVIVRADDQINTVDQVTLSDGVFSGTPREILPGDNTVTIEFKDGGDESEAIDYESLTPVGLTGLGDVKYVIPSNSKADVDQFEAAVANAIVNGGTLSVAKVGNDIVWTLTS